MRKVVFPFHRNERWVETASMPKPFGAVATRVATAFGFVLRIKNNE